jgi:Right handed beta helix region
MSQSSNVVIFDNIIEHNFGRDDGAGLDIERSNNLTINRNRISWNEGQALRASGIDVEGGSNISFINNLISHNTTAVSIRARPWASDVEHLLGDVVAHAFQSAPARGRAITAIQSG